MALLGGVTALLGRGSELDESQDAPAYLWRARRHNTGQSITPDSQFAKVHMGEGLIFKAELGTGIAASPMFFFRS